MTDPAEEELESILDVPEIWKKPKPKAKRRPKHRRTAQKVVAFQAPEEFAGMTATECCSGCHKDRCVISEAAVCAHPHKGGQMPNNADPKAVARFRRAVKVLEHQHIDLSQE